MRTEREWGDLGKLHPEGWVERTTKGAGRDTQMLFWKKSQVSTFLEWSFGLTGRTGQLLLTGTEEGPRVGGMKKPGATLRRTSVFPWGKTRGF